ncbi:hypothetical protein C0995_009100 [Termitomyces sp. Mi166|nr:hypothetical protein C0995_009100 [Termitomyces sp. Mi166\
MGVNVGEKVSSPEWPERNELRFILKRDEGHEEGVSWEVRYPAIARKGGSITIVVALSIALGLPRLKLVVLALGPIDVARVHRLVFLLFLLDQVIQVLAFLGTEGLPLLGDLLEEIGLAGSLSWTVGGSLLGGSTCLAIIAVEEHERIHGPLDAVLVALPRLTPDDIVVA